MASTTVSGYYQPLTMASLMLDRVIEGASKPMPEPFVYHATNVLLHMANCRLVFAWLRRFVGIWPAAIAAALLRRTSDERRVGDVGVPAEDAARGNVLPARAAGVRSVCAGRRTRVVDRDDAAVCARPALEANELVVAVFPAVAGCVAVRTAVEGGIHRKAADAAAGGGIWVDRLRITEGGWQRDRSDRETLFTKTPLIVCHSIVFYFYKLLCPMGICPQYPAPPLEQIRISNPMFGLGVIGVAALSRRRALLYFGDIRQCGFASSAMSC